MALSVQGRSHGGAADHASPGRFAGLRQHAHERCTPLWGLNEPVFDRSPALPIFKSGARNVHTAASALPIFGAGDEFLGALTLSGAASSLEAARTDGSYVARHIAGAVDLSRRLGASVA